MPCVDPTIFLSASPLVWLWKNENLEVNNLEQNTFKKHTYHYGRHVIETMTTSRHLNPDLSEDPTLNLKEHTEQSTYMEIHKLDSANVFKPAKKGQQRASQKRITERELIKGRVKRVK